MHHRHHHCHKHRGGFNTTGYIMINTRLCKACWKCVETCLRGVLEKMDFKFHKHVRISNPSKCIGCLACKKACPEGAIVAVKKFKGMSEE